MSTRELDYGRHYSKWHSNEPDHVRKMIEFYKEKAVHYFPKDKNIRILDIGCGMGFLLLALKETGYQNIEGIDSDESQVRACRENKLEVHLTKDSFDYLRQNKNRYDVITGFDLIEHIPVAAQIDFVEVVHDALKMNGRFLLTTPNANSVLAPRNRYIDYTHQCLFSESSLDFVLYNGGFKNIQIEGFEYVRFNHSIKSFFHRALFSWFRFFRRLELKAELGLTQGSKVPLSFNLIGIAEKTQ